MARELEIDNREFPIELKLADGIKSWLYSQLFVTPKVPEHSFSSQTIIITGANSGLGLEAARYYYKLGGATLILAVRSLHKGQAAKEDIVRSVKTRNDGAAAIQVWELDVCSTLSVLAFAERMKSLERVDVLLCNAGVNYKQLELNEGIERNMQVNVLNTFLLALASFDKMRETKRHFPDSSPHITITSSDAYRLTKFNEINSPNIYEAFNDAKTFNGQARYQDSKLIQLLVNREVVKRISKNKPNAPHVTFNLVSPGLCVSNIDRKDGKWPLSTRIIHKLLYRTSEVGSRTLVHGTEKANLRAKPYLETVTGIDYGPSLLSARSNAKELPQQA
ncbi:hypothetical protein NPX13_g11047 [Xylaria arbuscula]|uniref:NAD(P)-binding protein n=1 Tax=Xylaria arbuscula TaxID=114810 RepID=A0A9W8TG06_9PEZI|nr:hypothetical protein NPX13_g11047 [Xylaria arbuscula]